MRNAIFLIAVGSAFISGCANPPGYAAMTPEQRQASQQQFMNGLMLLQAARPQAAPMQPLNMGTNCISRYQPNGTIYTTCN